MTSRLRRAGLVALLIVTVIGSSAAGVVLGYNIARDELESESPEDLDQMLTSKARDTIIVDGGDRRRDIGEELNVSHDAVCFNYSTTGGDIRRDCHATVVVHSFSPNVSHIEITAVTYFGDSESWILYEEDWPKLIGEVGHRGTTFELYIGDFILVEAVKTNGSRSILWAHEFSCDDIEVGEPC